MSNLGLAEPGHGCVNLSTMLGLRRATAGEVLGLYPCRSLRLKEMFHGKRHSQG